MVKPVNSSISINYKAESEPMTPEELLAEQEALELEQEEKVRAEEEAEAEELDSPVDHEDEWEQNIEKLNDL